MNVEMKTGVDINRNGEIEPNELVKPADLKALDQDGDGQLRAAELKDVFVQYSPGVWAAAAEPYCTLGQHYVSTKEVNAIDYANGKVDLSVSIKPLPQPFPHPLPHPE